jgi:hypothetical protein
VISKVCEWMFSVEKQKMMWIEWQTLCIYCFIQG